MGIIETGTPRMVRGEDGVTELGKRIGVSVVISVALETKMM